MRLVLMAVMTAMGLAADTVDPGPPGASRIFTSNDPTVAKARDMLVAGRLSDAERLLKESSLDAALRDESLETIRRTRREYSLDADAMLDRVRRSIPDATVADLEKWQAAGEAQARILDGKVFYWNREPSNLFRFCDEAKRRREVAGKAPAKENKQLLIDHIKKVLAEADTTGKVEVVPVRHRVRYSLTVEADRPGAKAGSVIRCWLPFPQEYRQQKDVKLISATPGKPVLAPNGVFKKGGGIEGAPQRTLYFEQRIEDPSKPLQFSEEVEYVSYAYCPKLDDAMARPLPEGWTECLGERLPHIALTPEVRAETKKAVGDETNPLARARKVYLHLCNTLKYAYEEEYTVIPSICMRTLTRRRGDCGAQGLLFITMCRAAGIPARWQSGWESKPGDSNMHDWAEFYVEPWGWLPADVSYGLQTSDDPRVREYYFGHQDSYRMIVNLDYGQPLHPAKAALRSEPADFQRGEVEIDGRNLYFNEWTYRMQFDLQ